MYCFLLAKLTQIAISASALDSMTLPVSILCYEAMTHNIIDFS